MHSIAKWFRELVGWQIPIQPSTSLDDLLTEITREKSYERRTALWAEVSRRFVQDVGRACRVAGFSDEKRGAIMEEALRSIGPDPVAEFSRELVRIVGFNVGQKAVSVVQRTLYLRQFLHCLPRHLIPYVEGLLDCELDVELLAARRNEHLEKVSLLCAEAWAALPRAIESEYDDQDLATRTDGFWSIAKLKEL